MAKHLYQHIESLWQYMLMEHSPEQSDIIFVLCSNDIRVAEHAASLYLKGLAPKIVFSGGEGRFTNGLFDKSEAETFAAIARDCGVPAEDIIIENLATNTGENVLFTHKLLQEKAISPERIILVQKPFMERRTYATFMKQWPDEVQAVYVTSPYQPFFDYLNEHMTLDLVVEALLSDYERILNYPAFGFQIEQPTSPEAQHAYEKLREVFVKS
ncbi:YdcF family protein [Vibrio paucivorans]